MFYLYIAILILCLLASIVNKVARDRFLWIYFTFIIGAEVLIYTKVLERNFYEKANCIHLILMCWFFKNEINNRIFRLLLIVICLLAFILLIDKNILKIDTNILKSFIFVFLSIYWYCNQIQNANEVAIYKKIAFWVSFSILIWSTVFLIRVVPAHFFEELDSEFLLRIDLVYKWTTIISYLLFLRASFSKQ